jgi:hypothetical protein
MSGSFECPLYTGLWKRKFKHQFYQYQQNQQSSLILTEHKKTIASYVGNPGPGLRQVPSYTFKLIDVNTTDKWKKLDKSVRYFSCWKSNDL